MPQHALAQFCLSSLLAILLLALCGCAPATPPTQAKAVEAPVPPPPSETAERYLLISIPTDQDIEDLIVLGKDYRTISLTVGDNLTDKGFQALQNIPSLRELQVQFTKRKITPEECQAISEIPYLQNLSLTRSGLSSEIIPQLASLKYLTILTLREPSLNFDKLQALFQALPQLREVDFIGSPVTPEMCRYLSQTHLTRIEMAPRQKDVNQGIPALFTLKTLTHLNLRSEHLTDQGLTPLPENSHLESLSISSDHITDQGIRELKKLKNLKSLTLHLGKHITEDSFASIGSLKNIERLYIQCDSITDEAISHLNGMESLVELRLRCLSDSPQNLSGRGFKNLTSLPSLESLKITKTNFKTKHAHYFKQYPNLKYLTISQYFTPYADLTNTVPEDEIDARIGTLDQLHHLKQITWDCHQDNLIELHRRLPHVAIMDSEYFTLKPVTE